MTRFRFIPLLLAALTAAWSCNTLEESSLETSETFTISIGLPGDMTRTSMGPSVEGHRCLYWSAGDRVALNGVISKPLEDPGAEADCAEFSFGETPSAPYRLLYPASFYKNENTVTLPAEQQYVAGNIASETLPLAAQVADFDDPASLGHLCAIIQLSVRKDANVSASSLSTVCFSGNAGEQVCGDFTIDYSAPALSPAGSGSDVTLNVSEPLSEADPLDLFIVVPAGTYSGGFSVTLEDNTHRTMGKIKDDAVTLAPGKLVKMTAFTFVPSAIATRFDIEDVIEDIPESEENDNDDSNIEETDAQTNLEKLLSEMKPLDEDALDIPVTPDADDSSEEENIDATLEQLATEFVQTQDKIASTTKSTTRNKIGKLRNILPFKQSKHADQGLGDLFGWAGVAANDEEFSVPGFFTTSSKK